MQTITTIGLDIAKSVFQVHGVAMALACAEQRCACPLSGICFEDLLRLLTAALGRAPRRRESPVEEDATRIVVD